jgi:hypothetical protein
MSSETFCGGLPSEIHEGRNDTPPDLPVRRRVSSDVMDFGRRVAVSANAIYRDGEDAIYLDSV